MSPEIVRWIKIVVLRTLKEKNLTRLDVSTLISAGMLGYVQSLRRFDVTRGVKFKTFAEYRIKGAVLDEVRKMIGDERCKNRRPRRVDDYDYTMISDDGMSQSKVESGLDLERFFKHVALTSREIEILKCRYHGMNLREISQKFGFSESRASQLLAKIKKEVYLWYRNEMGVKFKLQTVTCPCCKAESVVAEGILTCRCDTCDGKLMIVEGNPIVMAEDTATTSEVEESDNGSLDLFELFEEDNALAMG